MPEDQQPYISRAPELLRDLGFSARSRVESRWAVVDGRRMHSRSTATLGGGEPCVLIHGLVISSLYMLPLAECLAARQHEVHALDLPGFGRSEAPREVLTIPQLADAVVAWLEQAGLAPCHLIGNSLGCEIAAHVAVKAPARVARLTLIGPTLDPESHAVIMQTLRLLRDAWTEPVRLWLNWAFDFFRAGVRRALGTTRAMFRDHIENQLPRITAPTLIIRGGTDPTVPQSAAETMHRLLRDGDLLVIEGEPHCVHYTAPETVRKAIDAHAARTSGAAVP